MPTISSTSSSDSARPEGAGGTLADEARTPLRGRAYGRAFVLAVAIICASEIALAALLPRNPARHRTDHVLTTLDSDPESRPLAVWGDSVTAGCLDGTPIASRMHDLSSTQAISTAGVYYTWRRLVESAGAPRVLVLVVRPESWSNDLDQIYTHTYFETCFIRPGEIAHFAAQTGRVATTGRMLIEALFVPPSFVRRSAVRRELNRLRGAVAPPHIFTRPLDGVDPETATELARRRAHPRFRASEIAETYLPLLVRETGEKGTRLVLMTPALPRSIADAWEESGYMDGAQRWLADVVGDAPHVTLEAAFQFALYRDVDMYDSDHLKPERMEAYGRVLSGRLDELLADDD